MAIHHDKLLYGKLEALDENIDEMQLAQIAETLNVAENSDDDKKTKNKTIKDKNKGETK